MSNICSRNGCSRQARPGLKTCQVCSDVTKQWNKDNPTKRKAYQRKHQLGVTQDRYDAMLDMQNGRCAICNVVLKDGSRTTTAQVDHNHKNFEIRGLLCHNCNIGLGYFKDDTVILLNAVSYLNHYIIIENEPSERS
jgi:recombination endonuclease VII